MTRLQLDDPLTSTGQAPPKPAPVDEKPQGAEEEEAQTPPAPTAPAAKRGGGGATRTAPRSSRRPTTSSGDSWHSWSADDRPQTYRLPPELINELKDRTGALKLPIGVTVAAAVAAALDLDDGELMTLVERGEEARERGRRAARREH